MHWQHTKKYSFNYSGESFGQSVQLVHKIICTYPFSSYVSDSQQSIVGKLDDKYRLVDTIV